MKPGACLLLLGCLVGLPADEAAAEVLSAHSPPSLGTHYDFRIRWGQGGFRDRRSPINKLGGGQLTLDIKPDNSPLAFSLSGEYYTNSPEPVNSYEIADLTFFNILYMDDLPALGNTDFFVGGGVGRLTVPRGDENTPGTVHGHGYDLEAGVHYRPFRRFGFYGLYKYLYAYKESNGVKLINFDEHIILLGVTYNFRL